MMDVRRREQLITLSLAIGLLVTFAMALLLPGSRRLRDLRQQSGTLVGDQERFAEEYVNQAPQLAKDIARLKGEVGEAVKRVPPEDIRVDFEQSLWELGERYGLQGRDYFRATTYERDGSITMCGARLRFVATFERVYAFLKELGQDEKLTVVQDLDMKPIAEREGHFNVSIELKYFYGEL